MLVTTVFAREADFLGSIDRLIEERIVNVRPGTVVDDQFGTIFVF